MDFLSFCGGLYPFIKLIKKLISLLQLAVPLALFLFGSLDFGKAVIAGKEDEMKKAQSTFIKRVIYAVVVFLVFTIVTLVMNVIADTAPLDSLGEPLDVNSWRVCWQCESKEECEAIGQKDACYSYIYKENGIDTVKYEWGKFKNVDGYNLHGGIKNREDCLTKNKVDNMTFQ